MARDRNDVISSFIWEIKIESKENGHHLKSAEKKNIWFLSSWEITHKDIYYLDLINFLDLGLKLSGQAQAAKQSKGE